MRKFITLVFVAALLLPINSLATAVTDSTDVPIVEGAADEPVTTDAIQEESTEEILTFDTPEEEMIYNLEIQNSYLQYIFSFLLFFVVVLLCKYSYSFFNIFF